MTISEATIERYRKRLHAINAKAAEETQRYLELHNFDVDDAFIQFAYGLTTKYGEAAGALACQTYDELHEHWKTTNKVRKAIKPAEPASAATLDEVRKAVYGSLTHTTKQIPGAVYKLVKQAAEDTTVKNAVRDGAYFAWIPSGDSCAFCLMLAGNGFVRASKNTLKKGHVEHIHANCDCTFAVSFDADARVGGYEPSKYQNIYKATKGDNYKEKLANMRQDLNIK